ncbi:uncharacterized protein LOC144350474 [Saccoglossus kowalevskii]
MRPVTVIAVSGSLLKYSSHGISTRPVLSRSYTTAAAATSFVYKKRLDTTPLMSSRLAGRQWLPGGRSSQNKYPQYIASPRDNFPAVYTLPSAIKSESLDEDTMRKLSETARDLIERKLHIHGAILFTDMSLINADDFSRFMNGLGYSLAGYEGGTAVRHNVASSVLTASNDPPSYTIEPHNEMSYTDNYPLKGFFTENKSDVDRFMKEHNRTHRWNEDGSLSYWYTLPAFVKHPKTGEEVWFNQLHSHNASYFKDHPSWTNQNIPDDRYPFHSYYGDGSVVEPGTLQQIRDVSWELSVGFQLKKGDVIVLDNLYTQHARLGFSGQRKLLVSIVMD